MSFFSTIPGSIIVLLVGFVLLIKGADYFVEGSSSIAKKLRIPSLIIGMTIVAMGTSLPECAVSVSASIAGKNGLAIGNVVGSNIFNLLVVLGSCALFSALKVADDTLKKDFPFSIICAALLLILGIIGNTLGHIDGIVLIVLFICFIIYMVISALKNKTANQTENIENELKNIPIWLCIIYVIGGAVAICFGGDWVVDSCSIIAKALGMSDTLVGLTIAAIGTSLPELVTSIVAAKKKELDMAIGNVVGSNIFNIVMVLGIASAISPISFVKVNLFDTIILIISSIIVLIMCKSKKMLNRANGIIMIVMYAAYMTYIIVRDGGVV